MDEFYLGLDLGQVRDYTALVVVQPVTVPVVMNGQSIQPDADDTVVKTESHYHIRHLDRFSLGTPYPSIVRSVKERMDALDALGTAECIVDATGVGTAVVDLLEAEGIHPLHQVTITGGERVRREGKHHWVPKRDLVGALQVELQNGTLKIALGLPLGDILVREMQSFRAKITVGGQETFEAWRERDHDDLVLALAMAVWRARDRARMWHSF